MKLKKFNLDIGQMSKQQKTGLFIIMMVLIAGIFAYKPVSYTHLTLPTNREV